MSYKRSDDTSYFSTNEHEIPQILVRPYMSFIEKRLKTVVRSPYIGNLKAAYIQKYTYQV